MTEQILAGREPSDVYADCYSSEWYRMGRPRFRRMKNALRCANPPGTFMDVGCGRAELVDYMQEKGFDAFGCDIVPALCLEDHIDLIKTAADMPWPDECFDVVTCSDVLEHVDPAETYPVIEELRRITAQHLIVHVAWYEAKWKLEDGTVIDLHCNKRDDWKTLLSSIGPWSKVTEQQFSGKQALIHLER